MDIWIISTLILVANFFMMLFLFFKMGGFKNTIEWQWLFVNFVLLFRRKIPIRPHIQHYSPNQRTPDFFLVKTYKCSEQRFFKIMSGTYTTIVPESEIYDLVNNPIKQKL